MLELLNGEQWQRWVAIPIRMILGVGFMAHGWVKWSRGPAASVDRCAAKPPTAAAFVSSRLTNRCRFLIKEKSV
jgi:hypothetical protein